jgi:hypothetical protein
MLRFSLLTNRTGLNKLMDIAFEIWPSKQLLDALVCHQLARMPPSTTAVQCKKNVVLSSWIDSYPNATFVPDDAIL